MKKQTKITNPYSLRMRTFNQLGKPNDWINSGTGQFTDIETVQRQIRTLKANYPNRTLEIEFKHKNELKGYDGSVTGKSMIYKRRD